MKKIRLKSPAKVNLYLKVLSKRPDGFHELETVFERIGLFDEISLINNESGQIRIQCNHPDVPCDERNLAHKAARLLQQTTKVSNGVTIRIKKNIPVAAGLAGGSSNAATVLMGLNRLWKLGLSRRRLANLAGTIGSDITFFLYNTPFALGQGRGERIKPLRVDKKLWHVLVVPHVKLLTRDVFGAFKLGLTNQKGSVNILIRHLKKSDLNVLSCLLTNDLEPVAMRLCPRLKKIKRRFQMFGADRVLLSGSGPSIYALIDSKKEAQKLARKLTGNNNRVYIARTI